MDLGRFIGIAYVVCFFVLYYFFRLCEKKGEKEKEVAVKKEINIKIIKEELNKCIISLGRQQATGYNLWIANLIEDIELGYYVTPKEAIDAIEKTINELQSRYDVKTLLIACQRLSTIDS